MLRRTHTSMWRKTTPRTKLLNGIACAGMKKEELRFLIYEQIEKNAFFLCVKLMLIFSFLLLQARKCSCSPKIEPALTKKNYKVDEVRYFSARIFLLENLPNRSNFVDYDTYSIRTWWPHCRKLSEMGPIFPSPIITIWFQNFHQVDTFL